jgi:hypothetical protein
METPIPIGNAAISPNQISLIDSIEEIQQSLNERLSEDRPTLGQKLQKNPIGDLRAAIGINQKFRFISELFAEDSEAFYQAVDKLNSFTSYLEADDYLQNTLKERYEWQPKSPVVRELIDLVERRYL